MVNTDFSKLIGELFAGQSSPQRVLSASAELDTLRQDNVLLRAVMNNYPGGIALYDSDLRLVLCNETLKAMLDYPPDLFAFGRPSMEQIFRFNAMRGEYGKGDIESLVAHRLELARLKKPHVYERKRPNGMELEVRGVPLEGGGFLTIYTDITEKRRIAEIDDEEAHVEAAAPLPGLTPMSELRDRLDALLPALAPGSVACLHYLDLDDFRMLRHQHGQRIAEWVIKEVSHRLVQQVRAEDLVASAGGDKFMILQTSMQRPSDVTRLASRVHEAIRQPIWCGSKSIIVGCSVGFALAPRDGHDSAHLINKSHASLAALRNKAGSQDGAGRAA